MEVSIIFRYKKLFIDDINIKTDKRLMDKNIILKLRSGYLGIYNLVVLENKDGDLYYLFKDIHGTSINNICYEDLEQLNCNVPVVEEISAFLEIEGWDKPLAISDFEIRKK